MMVKICGITSREDALASVAAGASAVGFNFYPGSPRYVDPERAAGLGRDLPVLKVGVFVNEAPERVEEIARVAGIDVVQLHGDERPDQFPALRVWKALRATGEWDVQTLDRYSAAEAVLLDGPVPGSGQPFEWTRAQGLRHRIILAGGLDADNVADAILTVRPWGVDACSRLEKAPGIKDHDKVLRFVRAAMAVSL